MVALAVLGTIPTNTTLVLRGSLQVNLRVETESRENLHTKLTITLPLRGSVAFLPTAASVLNSSMDRLHSRNERGRGRKAGAVQIHVLLLGKSLPASARCCPYAHEAPW